MKWKLKALAAAIALAVSAPASAAIATSGTGDGELFFSAWDSVTETSYTRDLGLKLSQFVTQAGTFGTSAGGALGASNLVFAADAVLTNWLSGLSGASLSGLQWNVAAMDGSGQNRYLTTAGGAVTPPLSHSGLALFNDGADVYITNVNSGPYVSGNHNVDANGSAVFASNTNPAGYAGATGTWSSSFGGAAGFSNAGNIGDDLNFFVLYSLGTTALAGVGTDQFDNAFWNFASNGALTYGTSVAAVPVPAAVWLLGSGLLGLAGIARRRQMKLA